MTPWSRRIPFKVDVVGIIEIMGSSLYSRADTPIRELIQNAHDAVVRRRRRELAYRGRIDVAQESSSGLLHFCDDGIGLSVEEAEHYLSTLGVSLTGLLKREAAPAEAAGVSDGLIGQFGIGLFSAFLLADRVVVESRKIDSDTAVRWEAGAGTDILLSSCDRSEPGTRVTLHLKPVHRALAEKTELLEATIKEFADFLTVPIHLNGDRPRVNVIQAAWFDPTPDAETVELELEGYFGETPLDILSLQIEKPVEIRGALYVTPRRVPGFAGDPVVTVTVRRMVISRQIRGLLPEWASFLRGVLELGQCLPTASREDLVRDAAFERVRAELESRLLRHFEQLAERSPPRWESILAWHRYTLAGSALQVRSLRDLLRRTYRLPTSQGLLTFEEILDRSAADPLIESEADRVVWYNTDRRQESWMNSLFAQQPNPCVHALRSFEEMLLDAWAADARASGTAVDLRTASPGAANFAQLVLGARDLEDAPEGWQQFLNCADARILCASLRGGQPVMAFLNERHELQRTCEDLKKQGTVPGSFQRLIDTHFDQSPPGRNEVLLNRDHRLVGRALAMGTRHPLASVLRLLVLNALTAAGAAAGRTAAHELQDDLDWIADTLWGKDR